MAHPTGFVRRHHTFHSLLTSKPQYVDKLLFMSRHFSLTFIQISAAVPYIDLSSKVNTGQINQSNSCASIPSNRPENAIIGLESHPSYHSSQTQFSQYLYLQGSTSNYSTVVLDEPPAGTSLSSVQKPITEQLTASVRAAVILALAHIVLIFSSSSVPVLVISTLWLYFTGSLFFDIAHYLLHKFSKSQYRILRRIGYLHEVHHLYFNRRLRFNNRYRFSNTICELPLELSCQICGTWLGYLAAQALSLTGPGLLSQELLHLVLIFEVARSSVVAILEGRDSNHQSYCTVVPKAPHSFLVGPEYHALHHVDPSAYISSSFRFLDWLLGTSYTLRARRVALAGLSGPLARALKSELQAKEMVSCVRDLSLDDDDDEKIVDRLANTDVLILSNEEAFECRIKIIELFRKHYTPRRGHSFLLPEIWYFGNQKKIASPSPSAAGKKTFTNYARRCYDAEDIVYRHIVLSTPVSKLGYASLGHAKAALWWIRRGARYVPVTDPVSALCGYVAFFYGVRS
jgi:sterol desaturase/sphingolipid hydroxylase (fatty acid hydroxylase superfamily)